MSRGSWAKRNEWEDKNSYFFGINASYFSSGAGLVYFPLVGSILEGFTAQASDVQFIPPGSGRLLSISTYSSNGTAPGTTIVRLIQNGGPSVIGQKSINISSQTVETSTFKDELTSGTFEWNINDGTSLAISIDPTNTHDNMNVFVLFEIYK